MSEAFEIVKTGIDFFCSHLVFFNMLFAIVIVFFQRRDPKSVWAWLLLLYFIPVLGFVFYLFLGQDMHKRKMFRIKVSSEGSRICFVWEHQGCTAQLEANLQDCSYVIEFCDRDRKRTLITEG